MKYSFAAVACLVAGAIAAPTMVDNRQMTAIHVLYDNREALQLTPEEMDIFDKFMGAMQKRDVEAGAPMDAVSSAGGAPMAAPSPMKGGNPIANLTGAITGALGGGKPGGGSPLDAITGALGGITGGLTGGQKGGMKKGGLLGGILIPGIL